MSSSRSRDSIKNITNAVGHEGGPGTPFLRPRPKPAGGPRAVPELDGPGGSGWGDATSPSPAHPHAVAEDGAAGRPGGISRPIREDRGGMWVAPDELSSAPHSTAVRGGAVGGAAAASSEPPGLRRPEASHPQRVGRNPEQHRQRFRSLELGENGRPFVMAHQLRDACRRWLLAGESDVDQIIDRVVLEQFIARGPTSLHGVFPLSSSCMGANPAGSWTS